MNDNNRINTILLGIFLFLGLSSLGYLLGNAAIKVKEYERTVTAKGLSEKELEADIVIWPIQFTETDNDLEQLYLSLDSSSQNIKIFLESHGVTSGEISFSIPAITDRFAQNYGGTRPEYRFAAQQSVTVYSHDIHKIRKVMTSLSEIGKKGIVITAGDYQTRTEYIFTKLNDIKPEMIAEATMNAREVALKFAADSKSKLGKIKRASQGQFTITERDKNNPHIKKVRVVSTVTYYLSD